MKRLRAAGSLAWWPALLLAACSGAGVPAPGADAGPGEDASTWEPEIAEPEPPAPPALPELPAQPVPPDLPRMTPCPEGWRERVDPDNVALVTCDPWPEGGQQQCAEDEAHFPGRPGCERIGPACPEGDWPVALPEDGRVLYVRAGEPEGGDGSRDRPFGRIADAVAAAEDGDAIALSKGLFDEELRIDRAVTLAGACVLETRIAPSEPGSQPAALTVRAAAIIRDLQVGGAVVGVDVSRTGGTAVLDAVLVREATGAALEVGFRGSFDGRDLVVRDTVAGLRHARAVDVRSFRSADNALVGVLVASGSDLDLHEGVVSGNWIGANVQVDGYDLDRLQDEVVFVDNTVNTDATRFEPPDPPELPDWAIP